MKSVHRNVAVVVVALILLGISVFYFRNPTKPVPASSAKIPSLGTATQIVSAAATNPQVLTPVAPDPPLRTQNEIKSADWEDRRLLPLRMMQETLALSDEQTKKLEPLLQAQQKRFAAFRRETSLSRQQRLALLKEMREINDAQLKSVLTPQQFEKWSKRGVELQKALR